MLSQQTTEERLEKCHCSSSSDDFLGYQDTFGNSQVECKTTCELAFNRHPIFFVCRDEFESYHGLNMVIFHTRPAAYLSPVLFILSMRLGSYHLSPTSILRTSFYLHTPALRYLYRHLYSWCLCILHIMSARIHYWIRAQGMPVRLQSMGWTATAVSRPSQGP